MTAETARGSEGAGFGISIGEATGMDVLFDRCDDRLGEAASNCA